MCEAISRVIIIVDISQCDEGSIDPGRYQTSRHLLDMDVLSGYDMDFRSGADQAHVSARQRHG